VAMRSTNIKANLHLMKLLIHEENREKGIEEKERIITIFILSRLFFHL
jgi:hypothetical protein